MHFNLQVQPINQNTKIYLHMKNRTNTVEQGVSQH